jgi:hypothetical protein
MDMDRRTFLGATVSGLALAGRAAASRAGAGGEVLPNGIRLPAAWPPRPADVPATPATPHYLLSPPRVIPIDVGRQLFVDDFLVADTTLERAYHRAEYHPASPVLQPDRPWEPKHAFVYSDGVWYDPSDSLFKMWYLAGPPSATCYATSTDGIRWDKPRLDAVKPGTNIVQVGRRDSSTVWLDQEETDPARRFKMFRSGPGSSTVKGAYGLATFFSPDGVHWTERPMLTGSCGDRSTVFYNPFRKVWVYSLRHGWGQPRSRRYWERADVVSGPMWSAIDEPSYWTGADALDPPRDDLKTPCQLYNLDGIAYESLILGLFTIWHGQPAKQPGRDKPNEVTLGFSRDGWSWSRPDRRPFCPVSESPEAWNYGNVQSAGGGCLVVGDRLYFYVSGRRLGRGTTGLAVLRRDGFASMGAPAGASGVLTTRPVEFSGKHLFVNVDAPRGELTAEVLDEHGNAVGPYSRANCRPVRGDTTRQAVRWDGAPDLSPLAGKPVRFRFHLRDGKFYAFWVSPDPSGASRGHVAAGGPGYTGPMDVGRS